MGERASRGAHHGVEADTESPRLLRDLPGGRDVAEPAERRMAGRGVDHVGPASPGRQRLRAHLHRGVRRRLVLALGEGVEGRAQHPVEQQVAGAAVEIVHALDPVLELDVDPHAEPARRRGGDAHQVRLHRPGDQHRVGALRQGLAEVEFELAHLVAAQREPGAVVALYI